MDALNYTHMASTIIMGFLERYVRRHLRLIRTPGNNTLSMILKKDYHTSFDPYPILKLTGKSFCFNHTFWVGRYKGTKLFLGRRDMKAMPSLLSLVTWNISVNQLLSHDKCLVQTFVWNRFWETKSGLLCNLLVSLHNKEKYWFIRKKVELWLLSIIITL